DNGKRVLTTQVLIKGHPQNDGDMVYQSVRDPRAREALLVDFAPLAGSTKCELSATFDIVLGLTPEAPDAHEGGIGPSEAGRGGGGPGGPRGPGGPPRGG